STTTIRTPAAPLPARLFQFSQGGWNGHGSSSEEASVVDTYATHSSISRHESGHGREDRPEISATGKVTQPMPYRARLANPKRPVRRRLGRNRHSSGSEPGAPG